MPEKGKKAAGLYPQDSEYLILYPQDSEYLILYPQDSEYLILGLGSL